MITLPDNIIGMKYEDAEKRLTEIGFVCKRLDVRTGYDTDSTEKVVAIGLQENKEYAKGTEVTLRVFIPKGEPVTDDSGEFVTDSRGNVVYEEKTEPESTDYYYVPDVPSDYPGEEE